MSKIVFVALCTLLTTSVASAQSAFEGPYVGVYAGTAPAGNNPVYQAGLLAGARLTLGEVLLIGLETQVGRFNDSGAKSGYEFGGFAQIGTTIGDNAMLFATAGLLSINSTELYEEPFFDEELHTAIGGGAEIAVNEYLHVRGELLRTISHEYASDFSVRANTGLIAQF